MDWINNVTSAFVIGRLSINPTIFIKQLTSAPAYAVRIGFRNWMKYDKFQGFDYEEIEQG